MKDVLIINPAAGKGIFRYTPDDMMEILNDAGIDAEAVRSESAGHASEIAEKAAKEGAARVFISGGDGSINEAVNGLIRAQQQGFTGTALGIFPNGRGNDFCDGIGMPVKKEGLTEVFKQDHRLLADIGAAGDGTFQRYFLNGAGFGIDSAINYHAQKSPFTGRFSLPGGDRGIHFQGSDPAGSGI